MEQVFPGAAIYDTKLTSSENRAMPVSTSSRKRPREGPSDWLVLAVQPHPDSVDSESKQRLSKLTGSVPYIISDMPKRASRKDRTWVTCTGNCAFRRDKPDAEASEAEAEGEADSALLQDSDDDHSNSNSRKHTVWSFARPVDYYTKVFRQACFSGSVGSVLIIQTTGCPNSYLAAFEVGIPNIIVFSDRPHAHQLWHGEVCAQEFFQERAMKLLGLDQGVTPVESLQTILQYIEVSVPANMECHLDAWDMPVQLQHDACAGLDMVHRKTSQFTRLSQEQCEKAGLKLDRTSVSPALNNQGVFSTTKLDEGKEICSATVLLFSSEDPPGPVSFHRLSVQATPSSPDSPACQVHH